MTTHYFMHVTVNYAQSRISISHLLKYYIDHGTIRNMSAMNNQHWKRGRMTEQNITNCSCDLSVMCKYFRSTASRLKQNKLLHQARKQTDYIDICPYIHLHYWYILSNNLLDAFKLFFTAVCAGWVEKNVIVNWYACCTLLETKLIATESRCIRQWKLFP